MSKINRFFYKKPIRIAMGIFFPICCIWGAIYLYNMEGHIPCLFQTTTGLYCPGCGAARASRSILHLDILKAMDYNILFVIFLPFVAYFVLKYYIKYVTSKDLLPNINISRKAAIFITTLFIVFWILRNIPFYPFTILAP